MKILYLCTRNDCLSIIAEAVTNRDGRTRLPAGSAGSEPVKAVHPMALSCLEKRGYPLAGLISENWNYLQPFQPRIIVKLDEKIAARSCPTWMNDCISLHWKIDNPALVKGEAAEVEAAFMRTIDEFEKRVAQLLAIKDRRLPPDELRAALEAI